MTLRPARNPLRLRLRVLTASVLVGGALLAQPLERGAFRMVWNVPANCPTGHETLTRIEALLGKRVSELSLDPLAARGRITQLAPNHYELVLETFQGEQRFLRTMQASSCGELTDAGALVLALAIDPTLSERAVGTPPVNPPAAPSSDAPDANPTAERPTPRRPRPTAAPAPPRAPADAPRPRHSPRFLLGARAVLDFGSIADAALGPGLSIALDWRAFEASLDGVWLPTRRTLAAPGKGGDISLAAAGLRGCYLPLTGMVRPLGCATFELGILDGNGVGTSVRTHRSGVWAAPGAVAGARLALGTRLLLSLGAGALVPVQPIDFTLDNVGLIRRVPSLVARGEVGLHVYFD